MDHGGLTIFGIEPRWPKEGGYDAPKHSGFRQNRGERAPALAATGQPAEPISRAAASRVILEKLATPGDKVLGR